MMKPNYTKNATTILLILLLAFNSVKAEDFSDYKLSNFSLHQNNWDNFSVSFKAMSKISTEEVKASEYRVEIFAEDGSLLKTFRNSANFSINDKNVGSKEKLTFKLFVEVAGEILVKETTILASEKSVIVKNNVNVPLEDYISIGNVYVNCELMRRNFRHQDKWDKVGNFNDVGVTLFISNGTNKDYVEVPINKKTSSFDLSNYKYFDDFKMQIEKDLYKNNCAEIKYHYQFNWDRNIYVIYGGSKNINKEKNQTVVYSFRRKMVQKLVSNTKDSEGVSIASAD